ncbi:serine/threonine-protein kinase Nek10 isoform X2 [Stegostoma tigrinum]|uniref:serine/threonine-protein kinase Nek10 isoform X2 n=1 Tax=Stegostoma tigrinum TaxID=3053191 RepID=UPI00202B3CF2|nr:serine/threonine-protein kinase Nek10 isoform X2 [Stegostoma tigrinum]
MLEQDKKTKVAVKTADAKLKRSLDKEYSDLKRLLNLLNVPASKQQLPALNVDKGRGIVTKSQQQRFVQGKQNDGIRYGEQQQQSTEAVELETFSVNYKNERKFSCHPHHKLFLEIFVALVKQRLTCRQWVDRVPPANFLRVLICLRLIMRDPFYQKIFSELGGVESLAQYMETVANGYLGYGGQQFVVDRLVTVTNIFQKLAAVVEQREWVIACGAHKTLVKLLAAKHNNVLLGALLALTSLAESPECRVKIGELTIVENLLTILQEYDLLSKRMTAELLRLLCADSQVREQVKIYEGIPILLSLLHSDHLKLLWSVVWILVQLCEDPDTSTEIRLWGGIQQFLHILQGDRNFVSDRSSIGSLSSANASGRIQQLQLSEKLSIQEIQENTLSLQEACCAAITELVLNDTNAQQVVQGNGIYVIGKLILPRKQKNALKADTLQCYAFRALRFLFSMERNRQLFKRLFPPDMFEMFIDVGHYARDIHAYENLVIKLNSLTTDELKQITENIEGVNQNKAPTKFIGNYAILDYLGSGAFGNVCKVRKYSGQNLLAMKEINLHNPAFGKDKKDRDSSVEKIVSELTIIREQLHHPNVVKYYKTFIENDRLYIVMELIEGAPLGEHFNSLKEKQQKFTEERIWNIFIQICLALRYLHKEKRIVHRDLTPNNIMLGELDKVTITDFGLAKQKQENSKMTSVVGTILYSCPEIVKSEPYGEKADIWAAGCILYQMATLNPPFYSSNMLSLATKIVEAAYEPIPEGLYSHKVFKTIKRCLTPDSEERPDVVEVSAMISDIMMKYMDNLCTMQITMEKKLDRERRRTQRYFIEANRNVMNYHHQISMLSQDHYDKSRLGGSSGTAIMKSESTETSDSPLDDTHTQHNKNGDERLNDAVFIENINSAENTEKDICLEMDDELNISDHFSSSSPSPIKNSTLGQSSSSSFFIQGQLPQSLSGAETAHLNNSLQSHSLESPGCLDITATLPRSISSIGTESQYQVEAEGKPRRSNTKSRPASAGIAVSQRKVRQISDPIQQILIQLHKIIYITQLPPTLHHNFRKSVIERFKKSLFSPQSNPCNLKAELKKVLQGSPELIELNFVTADCNLMRQTSRENAAFPGDRAVNTYSYEYEDGITYEQMQTMIEEVLIESGYYDILNTVNRNYTYPWAMKNHLTARR